MITKIMTAIRMTEKRMVILVEILMMLKFEVMVVRAEYMTLTTAQVNNVKMQIGKQRKKRNQMIVKSILIYAETMMEMGMILMVAMKRIMTLKKRKSQKMRIQLMHNSDRDD